MTKTNQEIDIRDTFVMPYHGKYYMYGTQGFGAFTGTPGGYLCYVGTDLEHWEGPYTVFPNDGTSWATRNYWAPEVYEVNGKFYMFSAWTNEDLAMDEMQQYLCVLSSDDPLGPFQILNGNLGPGNDPTLYEEAGTYYLIHNDGKSHMQARPLSDDFSSFAGEPIQLFDRTDPDVFWSVGGPTEGAETFVTKTGKLLILWSSFCKGSSKKLAEMGYPGMDYNTSIAYSDNGSIHGKFYQENVLLTPPNMGHVNLFYSLSGQLMLATHWPDDNENELGCSTPVFFCVNYNEELDTLRVDANSFLEENHITFEL